MNAVSEIARGLDRAARAFTPNWFAVTMGTGALSLALGQFPGAPVLAAIGEGLWLGNMLLFAAFAALTLTRAIRHPDAMRATLMDPAASMFHGCAPMGLATMANGFLLYGPGLVGAAAVPVAATLWVIDGGLALLCGLALPYLMFTRQRHGLDAMSALWLLPIVAAEVAAASGGLLLPRVADPGLAMAVLFASLVLWALSVPLAMGILTILFLRLALHKLPPATLAPSAWLALGPIGTGALGLLLFAQNGPAALAAAGVAAPVAQAFGGAALLGGALLWGYGLWWMGIAVLITLRHLRGADLPYTLGWWGYTFPLGVFALATLRLPALLPVPGLGLIGAGLVAVLAAIWIVVAARTAAALVGGALVSRPRAA
ncbi:MAG: C4-dicarboxylate ABC transporter [Rhodovulum sulfidophilum]|uniref:C4-dicarboxylate ABC transporter n=1 Tax=Rhodovulum sulfidophilum TaxID=35806 RepID=A0A2W5Q5B8_RHOSU|nr:MAG: C4-dicarboxylate ABC transporter [Rhodovulum sulfidophilum]